VRKAIASKRSGARHAVPAKRLFQQANPRENSGPMNRILRILFLWVFVLLIFYAILFSVYFHACGMPVLRTKTLWAVVSMAMFFLIAALRFSIRAKFKIFLVSLAFFSLELLLQATAWLGVLPGINTKLKAPYARVYWTGEGRGNSVRNRLGWNYPKFDLRAPRRIAFIGDSQVEAVEVHRSRNQAAALHELLKKDSPEWSVLGLGSHGTCPAYSMEVLEYACRHFRPQEAIVVVSEGSDLTEALPSLNGTPPDRFIYYDLGTKSNLLLNPASAAPRVVFRQSLELSHRSVFFNLPVIVNSHCMTLQLFTSLRDTLKRRHRQNQIATQAAALADKERAEFERVGFNPVPFAVIPDEDARRAQLVLNAELARCKEICAAHEMTLRVVLLPAFPKVFYDSQRGRDWTARFGNYDYLKPEREIAAFARSNAIPVLPLGEYIRAKRLDVETVRSLYLSGGIGHLSETGHQFCAQAIYETFYRQLKVR
jgi:hypothetical protein